MEKNDFVIEFLKELEVQLACSLAIPKKILGIDKIIERIKNENTNRY